VRDQKAQVKAASVGYQAHDPEGDEHPNMTMNSLVESVRPTGGLGIVGVFSSKDPKAKDNLEKHGQIAFDMGKLFEKGLSMGSGQADVRRYNRHLSNLIQVRPSRLFWFRMNCRLRMQLKRTNTLTHATKDGRRLC
jgi:glutathione-independent formaldehyde dehydrogenase